MNGRGQPPASTRTTPFDPHCLHPPGCSLPSIYQPSFVAGGAAVATSGERSGLLSLYCTRTGDAISRGAVHINIHAQMSGGGPAQPLLCSTTKAIYLYSPTWRPSAILE